MFLLNQHADYGKPLDPSDADMLGAEGADRIERFLSFRDNYAPTPLCALPALAAELGVGALHLKNEGFRLGLGSFKALGGAYAVIRLLLEQAGVRHGRSYDFDALQQPDIRSVAATMTFACATDGNHGRSVAQGAQLVGARGDLRSWRRQCQQDCGDRRLRRADRAGLRDL